VRADDADLPIFYRVVWGDHVAEFTDLSDAQAAALMATVRTVEKVLRAELAAAGWPADKFNIASLGNMVAHQHWHVVARYKADAFWPGSPWSERKRSSHATEQAHLQTLRRLQASCDAALQRQLDAP
jgi:diadenosine tetraphosphate (Ap4A) HIT family hydrolase